MSRDLYIKTNHDVQNSKLPFYILLFSIMLSRFIQDSKQRQTLYYKMPHFLRTKDYEVQQSFIFWAYFKCDILHFNLYTLKDCPRHVMGRDLIWSSQTFFWMVVVVTLEEFWKLMSSNVDLSNIVWNVGFGK